MDTLVLSVKKMLWDMFFQKNTITGSINQLLCLLDTKE